jgi:DNA-binding response OmpR family regulator
MPRVGKDHAPHQQALDDAVAPSTDAHQMVVLIAEDEETIAETLAIIVEDLGYGAVIAHDGRAALALARQHHPHLIITDLMMPHLSGDDLIAAVRRDAATAGSAAPPVIVVTAASRARAEKAGGDEIIEKPFDVRQVEAAVLRFLARNRL